MPSRGATLRSIAAATAAAALTLAAGCGGDDQGAAEQAASYRVAAHATFPSQQRLAEPVELRIAVRNTGKHTIPNVAATLATGGRDGAHADAFAAQSEQPGLASRSRPIWILDAGPRGGDTAFPSTWALGPIAPHRTKTFVWRVVPIRAGRYELHYLLAGSTSGRSQLRLADGTAPKGSLAVHVDGAPMQVRVTPSGRIVRVPDA